MSSVEHIRNIPLYHAKPAPPLEVGIERDRGIGWAVKQLHFGARVRRRGWNGKGMFLFLVPGSEFQVNRAPLQGIYPKGTWIRYHSHVDMFTADGYVVPWLCSQTDLLAIDWEYADEIPV